MKTRARPKKRRRVLGSVLVVLLALGVGGACWWRWVDVQIERYAAQDQAAPADAICVFGAAEYDGRPSPVYRARLDHARVLFNRNIAPLIITLGGDGGDQYSEGGVGREYLMGAGIPESAIIAETESRSHAICAADGLDVLTSPRPREGVEDSSDEMERIDHEVVSYTLWRLHLE